MLRIIAHNNTINETHYNNMEGHHNKIDHSTNSLQNHMSNQRYEHHTEDSHYHIDQHMSRYLGCIRTLQQDHHHEIEKHKENEINRQKEIERNVSHDFSFNM